MRILGVVSSSSREVPNAPTIGTATDVGTGRAFNNGAATVTFTAPTWTGGLPITGYTVTSNPGGFTGTGSASPITVAGLQSNNNYTFTVRATNAIGQSAASAASNSILATTVPQAPTIGTATAGNASATVGFTAGANNGGKAVSTFTATSSPGSFTGSSATSPITVSGLTNGTPYTFTVTATNANGTSAASAASNSVTPVNPIASFFSIGNTATRLQSTAVNSNAIYYVGRSPSGDQYRAYLFSVNKSNGSINWQRRLTRHNSNYALFQDEYSAIATDSSGNIYVAGAYFYGAGNDFKVFLAQYSSSGTLNWQRLLNTNGSFATVSPIGNMRIDSSNNIYITGNALNGFPYLWKLDSSGNFLWSRRIQVPSATALGNATNVLPTASLVQTATTDWQPVGKGEYAARGVLFTWNTSGTPSQRTVIGDTTPANQVFLYDVATDSSGNVYTCGAFGLSPKYATIIKADSSLNRIGSVRLTQNVTYRSMVMDSSNNIYVIGMLSDSAPYIAKYNSSLTLQWQRVITVGGGVIGNWTGRIALDESNNRFSISGSIDSKFMQYYFPTDGSGTGTYSVGGYSITYAAGSATPTTSGTEVWSRAVFTNVDAQTGTSTASSLTGDTPTVTFSTTTF